MATTRMISPGVFTVENNLSFLPQGISQIGGAFIGPFQQGPAFVPITVTSQADFTARFGPPTPNFFTPYAVNDYLRNANQAIVVRVLGLSGYATSGSALGNQATLLIISGNGGQYPLALLHPTQTAISIVSSSANGTPTSFNVTLVGTDATASAVGLSATPFSTVGSSSLGYFVNFFGTDPTAHNEGFVRLAFPSASNYVSGALIGSGTVTALQTTTQYNFGGASALGSPAWSNAETPEIISQHINGVTYNLFQVFTWDGGDASNSKVKIEIADVRPDPQGLTFGKFTLLVRAFGDTDTRPQVLEMFTDLTLDSTSPNYIAQRIGDSHYVINYTSGDVYLDGNFPPKSKYIYVQMDSGITSVPIQANPHGFAALISPLNVVGFTAVPAPQFVQTRYSQPPNSVSSVANNNIRYGFMYSDATSLAYLTPLPQSAVQSGTPFNLDGVADLEISASIANWPNGGTGVSSSLANVAFRKFVVPLQGGFDGLNPARLYGTAQVAGTANINIASTNTQGFDLSTSTSAGSLAYVQAINSLSNQDAIDINLLVLPGVLYSLHPYVAQTAITLCETRGDCFYVMDASQLTDSVSTAAGNVAGLDTTYAATYHPWLKILDTSLNRQLWVPPSVLLPGVLAFNDKIAAEWFAPAGLNRGGLTTAIQVRNRLAQADRDTLYINRVNPIAIFPNQGIVVWGQKTLPQKPSALDRVNVRRLLIAVKKFIASTTRYLVFEQNVDSTRQRFLNIVNPYLASVQERSGLYAFKVIMDDSNNTPDLIDRNILVGQLFLQPTKTAEFISLEFNILPTGAVFPTE